MAKRRFHLVDDTSNKFWEVWTAGAELHTEYGRIGTSGKTDFLYSRCVMLLYGRDAYEAAVTNPTLMPQGVEFEAVLSIAQQAHELKTGEELDATTPVSYESFSNEAGWQSTAKTKEGRATGANVPPGNRRPA